MKKMGLCMKEGGFMRLFQMEKKIVCSGMFSFIVLNHH